MWHLRRPSKASPPAHDQLPLRPKRATSEVEQPEKPINIQQYIFQLQILKFDPLAGFMDETTDILHSWKKHIYKK